MSVVCKQLLCSLNRFWICCRPTMVMSPFNSGRSSSYQRPSSTLPTIIREVEGDLFTAKRDTSLAHCVSSDMKMGAGIAVHFRSKFGRVDDLLSQKKTVGEVACLKDGQRFIFYLVTKNRYFHKPTEKTLQCSLLDMRDKCKKFGVTKLAMPRIGCGLDGLKWPSVFHLVQEVFENCGMEITIYSIPDMKRKSMTPNWNRSQGDLRNFFEPKRPHSLPANAMNSKRKFHTLYSEEDLETPKKRKLMTVSPHDRKIVGGGLDAWSPSKKKSSANWSFGTSVSTNHRNAGSEYDTLDAEALSAFSGDCPFLSSPKKRNSPPDARIKHSLDLSKYETSMLPAIPFLYEEDQDERNRTQNSNSELESPVHSDTISKGRSKYFKNMDEHSNSTREGRKLNLTLSDEEEELSEESTRHFPDHKRVRSASSSPSRKILEVTTPSSSSKKQKKKDSSKSHSEEKVKKEKRRRSTSKSHSEEKKKKKKRRSSSKSRSEEKIKKKKRRSSSRSRSEEKAMKQKRRSSSKNSSEEKPKKEKRRSSDILVRQSLDFVPTESSETEVNLVSERFPSFNKKRPSQDLSEEKANHPELKLPFDPPSDEEDMVHRTRETKKGKLVSPQKASSHRHSRRSEEAQEVSNMRKSLDSTGISHFSHQLRGRLGEIVKTTNKYDDSLSKKVEKTPEKQSFDSPKISKKALKSSMGRMYSDKETSRTSVRDRLSLGRKP